MHLSKRFVAVLGMVLLSALACGNGSSSTTTTDLSAKTLVVDDAYQWDFGKDADPSRGGVDFDADPFFHAIYDSLRPSNLAIWALPYLLSPNPTTAHRAPRRLPFTSANTVNFRDVPPPPRTAATFT